MPKKLVVTEVKIREEPSVSAYLKKGATAKTNMSELLKGVKDMKNWIVESKGETEVKGAFPRVDGHPGHVHGKDWKLNVERGNNTVDRLVLSNRRYTVTPNKRNPNQLNVQIYAAANCIEDTK